MAKSVTLIPQTKNIFTAAPIQGIAKRKVAGYARVSTDSDEQFTSYEAQVDYYTRFIQSHPEWEFVKVYTDEERSYPVLFQLCFLHQSQARMVNKDKAQ